MKNTQLLKGILEGCVLSIIDKAQETYGYEIRCSLIDLGFTDISEGTLYPMYLRLEKNNLIKSSLKDSDLGPKRKYYSLTNEGYEYLKEFKENWNELNNIMTRII